jgi:hypothetical protein
LEEVLGQRMSFTQLSAALVDLCGEDASAGEDGDKTLLCKRLLTGFGFPRRAEPRGRLWMQRELERGQSDLALARTTGAVRSTVISASTKLEYLLLVLLRFLAVAAYQKPPEQLFVHWKLLDKPLRKTSLGARLSLLQAFCKRVERDDSLRLKEFRRAFEIGALREALRTDLAEYRNRFVHFDGDFAAKGIGDLRAEGEAFFEKATRFLAKLQGDKWGAFPIVLTVESVHIDKFGRKVTNARTDGERSEVIFTGRRLEPGQTYFMLPLTNPLRVDPVLVDAGELVWND